MKKIYAIITLLLLTISLSACEKTNGQNFKPSDYNLVSEITLLEQSKSIAKVKVTITDSSLALNYVYLSVLDEKGQLVHSEKVNNISVETVIIEEITINYLLQNESYTVAVNGFLYEEGELLSAQLSSISIKTDVWNVTAPKGTVQDLKVGPDIVVFDVDVDFNDYKGRQVTFEIYDNDTLIDTFKSDILFTEVYNVVEANMTFEDVTFDSLESDKVYNLFIRVSYLRYDYEKEEYIVYTTPQYMGTFRTGKIS